MALAGLVRVGEATGARWGVFLGVDVDFSGTALGVAVFFLGGRGVVFLGRADFLGVGAGSTGSTAGRVRSTRRAEPRTRSRSGRGGYGGVGCSGSWRLLLGLGHGTGSAGVSCARARGMRTNLKSSCFAGAVAALAHLTGAALRCAPTSARPPLWRCGDTGDRPRTPLGKSLRESDESR